MYRSNLGTYIDIVITVHYIGEIPLGGGDGDGFTSLWLHTPESDTSSGLTGCDRNYVSGNLAAKRLMRLLGTFDDGQDPVDPCADY